MRQKRPRSETATLAADVHVHQQFVEALARDQAAGVNYYGQAVYPPAKRTRRCQARSCRPFVHCFQDPVPAPPEPAIQPHLWGYLGSLKGSLDVDGDLARRNGGNALPFSKEEDRLLIDARNLGKTFADIAKMLPARNITMLRKQYSTLTKPKPPPIKRPSLPVSANASPAPSPAAAAASAAAQAAATAASAKKSGSQEPSPSSKASPVPAEAVEVDYRCTNRAGGDARIKLQKALSAPPKGFTGLKAHKLASADGIKFFQKAEVVDPDDESKIYYFDLDDPHHCACFNIGQSDVLDEDGEANPIISWSDLHVLYQLPDGSKWAEHGNFYDCEDLIKHARELHKDHQEVLPKDANDRELLKKAGRSHSRLQNIEFECWVFKDKLPSEAKLLELGIEADNAYYSRITFDPKTLDKLP